MSSENQNGAADSLAVLDEYNELLSDVPSSPQPSKQNLSESAEPDSTASANDDRGDGTLLTTENQPVVLEVESVYGSLLMADEKKQYRFVPLDENKELTLVGASSENTISLYPPSPPPPEEISSASTMTYVSNAATEISETATDGAIASSPDHVHNCSDTESSESENSTNQASGSSENSNYEHHHDEQNPESEIPNSEFVRAIDQIDWEFLQQNLSSPTSNVDYDYDFAIEQVEFYSTTSNPETISEFFLEMPPLSVSVCGLCQKHLAEDPTVPEPNDDNDTTIRTPPGLVTAVCRHQYHETCADQLVIDHQNTASLQSTHPGAESRDGFFRCVVAGCTNWILREGMIKYRAVGGQRRVVTRIIPPQPQPPVVDPPQCGTEDPNIVQLELALSEAKASVEFMRKQRDAEHETLVQQRSLVEDLKHAFYMSNQRFDCTKFETARLLGNDHFNHYLAELATTPLQPDDTVPASNGTSSITGTLPLSQQQFDQKLEGSSETEPVTVPCTSKVTTCSETAVKRKSTPKPHITSSSSSSKSRGVVTGAPAVVSADAGGGRNIAMKRLQRLQRSLASVDEPNDKSQSTRQLNPVLGRSTEAAPPPRERTVQTTRDTGGGRTANCKCAAARQTKLPPVDRSQSLRSRSARVVERDRSKHHVTEQRPHARPAAPGKANGAPQFGKRAQQWVKTDRVPSLSLPPPPISAKPAQVNGLSAAPPAFYGPSQPTAKTLGNGWTLATIDSEPILFAGDRAIIGDGCLWNVTRPTLKGHAKHHLRTLFYRSENNLQPTKHTLRSVGRLPRKVFLSAGGGDSRISTGAKQIHQLRKDWDELIILLRKLGVDDLIVILQPLGFTEKENWAISEIRISYNELIVARRHFTPTWSYGVVDFNRMPDLGCVKFDKASVTYSFRDVKKMREALMAIAAGRSRSEYYQPAPHLSSVQQRLEPPMELVDDDEDDDNDHTVTANVKNDGQSTDDAESYEEEADQTEQHNE